MFEFWKRYLFLCITDWREAMINTDQIGSHLQSSNLKVMLAFLRSLQWRQRNGIVEELKSESTHYLLPLQYLKRWHLIYLLQFIVMLLYCSCGSLEVTVCFLSYLALIANFCLYCYISLAVIRYYDQSNYRRKNGVGVVSENESMTIMVRSMEAGRQTR